MSETRSLLRSDWVQPQLEIVEGLHAGVRLDLDDGDYSLGPNPSSDIVLRDKGVLPQHAILRIERGQVRVEATGGDVLLGKVNVSAGHGCHVRLPAVITVGEASLRLSRGVEKDATLFSRMRTAARGISGRPMEVAGGVLICAVAVTVLGKLATLSSPDADPSQVAISTEAARSDLADDTPDNTSHAAAPLAASTVKEAAASLDSRVRAAGIQSVRIAADDQRVSAQGRVNEAQAAQWLALQRWFDEKYGSSIVLTANVGIGQAGGPLLRLQAVWYGDRPYIIAENGAHYYESGVLDSGWIVQRISDKSVLLSKDNETFTLPYR